MAKGVEEFAYKMMTEVFNARDTAPLAIEAILKAGSSRCGPQGEPDRRSGPLDEGADHRAGQDDFQRQGAGREFRRLTADRPSAEYDRRGWQHPLFYSGACYQGTAVVVSGVEGQPERRADTRRKPLLRSMPETALHVFGQQPVKVRSGGQARNGRGRGGWPRTCRMNLSRGGRQT